MGKPLLCHFGMHRWVNQGTAESEHFRLDCRPSAAPTGLNPRCDAALG